MLEFYYISLAVSVGMVFWLFITDVRHSVRQYLMIISMVISNLGYIALAQSVTVEEAFLANKIIYVGGCFMPFFYLLVVCEVCRLRFTKWATSIRILLQCLLFLCVCTIGHNGLYYKSAELITSGGSAFLQKEYGPLHVLYPISLAVNYFSAVLIAIFSALTKRAVNRRGVWLLLSCSGVALGCYFVEKILDLPFEIIPLGYSIMIIGALIPIYESNLFVVEKNDDIVEEKLNQYGFISFDKHMHYMGCNSQMEKLFPELLNLTVGQKMPAYEGPLQENIIAFAERFKTNSSVKERKENHNHQRIVSFQYKECFFDGMLHTILNARNRLVGYTVEIWDDTEHRRALELSTKYSDELAKEVTNKTAKIREIQENTILGMAQVVESRDLSTGGHVKRTSAVVRIFSKELMKEDLGLSKEFLHLVIRSAPMHDLGKIGVDDAVLRKQGRYTDEEYSMMKKHSAIGARMVREILSGVEEDDFVRVAENVAHFHHEKVNGGGYPEGLKGDEIPIEARIMALADVFDALVSKRCYKEAFTFDRAFSIIKEDAGTHFDAKLAEIFLRCRPELEAYYEQYDDTRERA